MRSKMEEMMPSMMDQCHSKMSSEQMRSMMHEIMPKMMKSCIVSMTLEQRHGMLAMCRQMLDEIEDEYASQVVWGP